MPRASWTAGEVRILCLEFLKVVKGPGKCAKGTWALISRNIKKSIQAHNKRVAKKYAKGARKNPAASAGDIEKISCVYDTARYRKMFSIIRCRILGLRKERPPNPHRSKKREAQWVDRWHQSYTASGMRVGLTRDCLLECWRILKDAPQIADHSSAASTCNPRPTLRAVRLIARKSTKTSACAIGRRDSQHSDHEPDSDDNNEDDDTRNTDGDDEHEEEEEDASIAPNRPNIVTSRDDVDDARPTVYSSGNPPRQLIDRRRATARNPSRKRKRRRVSADPGTCHSNALTVADSDEMDSNTDDDIHVESADEISDDPRPKRTRRRHQHHHNDMNDNVYPLGRLKTTRRTAPMETATITSPQVLQGSKHTKLLREQLRVAKLERNYHELRIQEIILKLQVEKAKKQVEEARGDRTI